MFDKYKMYIKAVQSPETDVKFYQKRYFEMTQKQKPNLTLREDFCGTGIISSEWVKLSPKYVAYGVDLDTEPTGYGERHILSKLDASERKRIHLLNMNVMDKKVPHADIVAAANFSYFLFKKRQDLKQYFKNVHDTLNKEGIFIVDVFGGTQCTDEITDKKKIGDLTYYWDQKGFDPITNEAQFSIHFRHKGKMYKDLFTYDWRMWSIPELREIMQEAGFKETRVYWEGTNRLGFGNGKFTLANSGEPCLSWVAYIVGIK